MRIRPRWVLPALVLLLALDAGADEAANRAALKKKLAECKSLEEHVASLPPLGVLGAEEVFQLRVEGQHLVLRTTLDPGDRAEHAVAVEGLPGPASVSVRDFDRRPGAQVPVMFQFHRLNTTDPGAVYTYASLYARRRSVQLSGDWQFKSGSRSVQLIDDRSTPGPAAEAGDAVHLYVKEYSNDDQERLDFTAAAPDLKALARRHPREVNLYLRPLLRDLGREALLNVDPHAAWQVLWPEATPDEALRPKVAALLRQLDADAFGARRSAAAELKSLGSPAAVTLLGWDRAGWSHEQAARVGEILAPYAALKPEEASPLRDDLNFLLDCLASPDPDLQRAARHRLERKLGRPLTLPEDAAARPAAIETLRAELSPAPTKDGPP